MDIALYIAKRIISGKGNSIAGKKFISTQPIINIAVTGITLGIVVMICSVAILQGFQKEIKEKVAGFGGHVIISSYTENQSFESIPISKNPAFLKNLKTNPYIKHIQNTATKAAIVKHDADIEGIVLKGIDKDFNWDFFKNKLTQGKPIAFSDTAKSDEIIISGYLAKRMKYKVGDNLVMYFIQHPPRMRKFKIAGIYETGLEDYDKLYALADIKHIIKLNGWNDGETGAFEILLKDFNQLELATESIQNEMPYNLYAQSISEKEPQIFDWLNLQDINVQIILILMVLVAGINMITALLVLILEKTTLIGMLKALGMRNWKVRQIFLYNAIFLIGKGLLYGNLLGIGLCWIQSATHFIKMDQTSYYVSYIPIYFNWGSLLILNIGTIIICSLMLLLPTLIITRISPIKAIRYN